MAYTVHHLLMISQVAHARVEAWEDHSEMLSFCSAGCVVPQDCLPGLLGQVSRQTSVVVHMHKLSDLGVVSCPDPTLLQGKGSGDH